MDERECIMALYAGYDDICYKYKIALSKPVIEIHTNISTWGTWDPLLRTIAISRRLVENYRWDCVLNILKHELAHQITTEHFKQPNEAHGPYFKKACERLGLPSKYQRASCDLTDADLRGECDIEIGKRGILEKVKKLLSLAQSPNEHEALLAMQKVQELNAKYNINELPEQDLDDHSYLIIYTGRKRLASYTKFICSILTSHYFVEVIFSDEYNAKLGERYKTIELLGTQQNVEMAEYVYHFLVNKIEQLWAGYREQSRTKLNRSAKNSYCIGLASGFHKKLDAMQAQTNEKCDVHSPKQELSSERKEIVLRNDLMLSQFMRTRFPRIRRVRSTARVGDTGSYSQGVSDGRNIVLHKGLSKEATGNSVLALEL